MAGAEAAQPSSTSELAISANSPRRVRAFLSLSPLSSCCPSVNMSFSFAVGDFIAVGKLISDIVTSLQSVGGARSEYQEHIREFLALQLALQHLDQLEDYRSSSDTVQLIKYTALSCRYPLQAFLDRVNLYEASLGLRDQNYIAKRFMDKLRWTSGEKGEVLRLQRYLIIHIRKINMLLTKHGLEQLDLQGKKIEEDTVQVRQQFDIVHANLEDVWRHSAAQAAILRTMHLMLSGLYGIVCGDIKTSLQKFSQIINTIWYVALSTPYI
jgi:hypothetical protein